MNRKNILITGGLGLIGSTLISHLNRKNKDFYIVCVDTFSKNIKWKYLREIIVDELLTYEEFKQRKEEYITNADQIFHLGACSSTTEESLLYLYENNYRTTIDIIDLFIKCKKSTGNLEKKLVLASSAATYGDGSNGFKDDIKQLEKLRPLNPYGISKHLVDIYLKRKSYDSDVLSLKFFNIFGINEFHKGQMRSIAHWGVESIIKNNSIKLFRSLNPMYADGCQVRDFLDVDKAVEIMVYLSEKSCGIHNVGSGHTITWNEMAESIILKLSEIEKNLKIEYIDMPKHLEGKYQYFTCAEMSRDILSRELYPKKSEILKVLSNYSLDIYKEYK